MYFGLSEEQQFFQDSIAKYLEDNVTIEAVREYAKGDNQRFADDIHQGLVELGINNLIIPEQYGGLGLDLLYASAVSQSLGAGIAPVPYIGSYVMAPLAIMLAGSMDQKTKYLNAISSHELHFGFGASEYIASRENAGIVINGNTASGRSLFVIDDFNASHFLLTTKEGMIFIVNADDPNLEVIQLTTIDKTSEISELILSNCQIEVLEESINNTSIIHRVVDAGRIMVASDSLGASQTMIDKSVEYSKERKQFGRVIGSFQAVKHMCAEMTANIQPCYSMIWYAAHCQDNIPEEARLMATHTKAHVSDTASSIAKTSTEVHGGMGFTDDLGLHYWFKRIGLNRQLLGGVEINREEAAIIQNF
ncbi:acyl-CoA/acyl-ACP dehydrogenase [Gammaproteobacteria bacterium]|nr:acyl-CoA/acyl-ACP dehydrogenase [Gammaproteobacteria bacterium]